jgi:hypothetical protein
LSNKALPDYGTSRRATPLDRDREPGNGLRSAGPEIWTGRIIEMYRETMDQTARDEITAAAAAHRELGPQYDEAVAESLIDRIGDEIDRRVDARMGQGQPSASARREFHRPGRPGRPALPPEPAQPAAPARMSAASVVLALGSMGIGIGVAGTILPVANGGSGGEWLVALIWIIIGVINVAWARRR